MKESNIALCLFLFPTARYTGDRTRKQRIKKLDSTDGRDGWRIPIGLPLTSGRIIALHTWHENAVDMKIVGSNTDEDTKYFSIDF